MISFGDFELAGDFGYTKEITNSLLSRGVTATGLTFTGKTDAMVVQTASGRGRSADGGKLEPARATVGMLSASGGGRHSSFELATPTGTLSQTQFTCKASDFTLNRRIGAGEFAGGAIQGTVIHLPRARGDGAGDCGVGPVVPASGTA